MGSPAGQKIIYEQSGQTLLSSKSSYGSEAEMIKSAKPKIILETDKNVGAIAEIQRELAKLVGALR